MKKVAITAENTNQDLVHSLQVSNRFRARRSSEVKIRQFEEIIASGNAQGNSKSSARCLLDKKVIQSEKMINLEKINSLKQPENIQNQHEEQFATDEEEIISEKKQKKSLKQSKKINLFRRDKLGELIKKNRINALIQQFIRKIKRNNVSRNPSEYICDDEEQKTSFPYWTGIQLNIVLENLLTLFSIIQILTLIFYYSIGLVYPEANELSNKNTLQSFSFAFYFLELILNFFTMKQSSVKKLKNLSEIWQNYLHQNFLIDALSLTMLSLDLFSNYQIFDYLRLFIVFKLPHCLEKIEKLEIYWIKNVYYEQYWSLIKILLFNFGFAHILAIVLSSMVNLDPGSNWMIVKNIANSHWFIKYVWSYYWGINIMLTVGFGDISGTNHQEAICLIFIETISCLILAYNVHCIGTLITNIRAESLEKNKKRKTFKKMSDQHQISDQLSWKVNNFIEESSNLSKKTNFNQEKLLVSTFPSQIKKKYLKESNMKVFEKLTFFRGLMEKTICNFAEKIELKLAYPDETLRKIDDDFHLLILKQGSVGYACKKYNEKALNEKVINVITVQQGQHSFLLTLDFVSKKRPIYLIKSLDHSILYQMDYNEFINILKKQKIDYEYYCMLRDKIKNMVDEFQVIPCEQCETKHLKFSCPRLHFCLYEQQTINKYLHNYKTSKMKRQFICRNQRSTEKPLKLYKLYQISVQKLYNLQSKKQKLALKEALYFAEKNLLRNKYKKQKATSFKKNQNQNDNQTVAIQTIKEQFSKIAREKLEEDETGLLKSDKLENYLGYFQKYNPNELSKKYSEENMAKYKKKSSTYEQSLNLFITNSSDHQFSFVKAGDL